MVIRKDGSRSFQSIKDFCQADQDYEGSRLGKQIIVNGTFELDELVENLPEIKEKLANGGFHFGINL